MNRVFRCPDCGTNLVPIAALSGPTKLTCVFCETLEPMESCIEAAVIPEYAVTQTSISAARSGGCG